MADSIECVVIGAGVVGLAVARALAMAGREVLLLELPMAPLCRDDCRGLCPVCGADRNVEICPHQ